MTTTTKIIVAELNKDDKLDGDNYDMWRRKVQYILEEQEVLEAIQNTMEEPPQGNTAQHRRDLEAYQVWKRKNSRARATLLCTMQDDLMVEFSYTPFVNSSWTWRKICQVKDQMKLGFCTGVWGGNQAAYTVSAGYQWLIGTQPRVDWWPLIWNRVNIPKHAFIGWLAIQSRLMTKDRLARFGIVQDGLCEVCQLQDEDHTHLLYLCPFSVKCWNILKQWLQVPLPSEKILEWIVHWRCKSIMRKQILFAAVIAMVYRIWIARNKCRYEAAVPRPETIVGLVKNDVKDRCLDKQWPSKFQKCVWLPRFD